MAGKGGESSKIDIANRCTGNLELLVELVMDVDKKMDPMKQSLRSV